MLLRLALLSGLLTMLVPLKDMNDIRISGSLKNKSVFNYLLLWINYALWATYSSLLSPYDAICIMYFTGLIFSCGYCCYFILHVDKTSIKRIASLYLASLLIMSITIIYIMSGVHSTIYTNEIVGLIACIATVCSAGFPLLMSPFIAETGAQMISIPIYMANAFNSFLWFVYGFSVSDHCTANSNLFAFVLSSIGVIATSSAATGKVNLPLGKYRKGNEYD
jgi:hypothetical protein